MDLCELKYSLVYRGSFRTKIHREPVSKSQKLKVKIKETEVKRNNKEENTQRILILCTNMFSLNCLNSEKGTSDTKTFFHINAAELIQDRYFENILASKLNSKGMLIWRRDFTFDSSENERLCIYSELRNISPAVC